MFVYVIICFPLLTQTVPQLDQTDRMSLGLHPVRRCGVFDSFSRDLLWSNRSDNNHCSSFLVVTHCLLNSMSHNWWLLCSLSDLVPVMLYSRSALLLCHLLVQSKLSVITNCCTKHFRQSPTARPFVGSDGLHSASESSNNLVSVWNEFSKRNLFS